MGLGSAVSSPSDGSGSKPQPTNDLVHIGVKKSSSGGSSFLLILLRTNVIFCTKTSLLSYGVTVCIVDCQWQWHKSWHQWHLYTITRSSRWNKEKIVAGSNSSQGGALWGVFLLMQSPPLPYGSRRLYAPKTVRADVFQKGFEPSNNTVIYWL